MPPLGSYRNTAEVLTEAPSVVTLTYRDIEQLSNTTGSATTPPPDHGWFVGWLPTVEGTRLLPIRQMRRLPPLERGFLFVRDPKSDAVVPYCEFAVTTRETYRITPIRDMAFLRRMTARYPTLMKKASEVLAQSGGLASLFNSLVVRPAITRMTQQKESMMTPAEKRERERLVKGMKKSDWSRYGDDAERVMYATATEQAKEAVDPDATDPSRRPPMIPVDESPNAYDDTWDDEWDDEDDDDFSIDVDFEDDDVDAYDDRDMMLSQLDAIRHRASALHHALRDAGIEDVPAWIQDKVSVADHNMNAILDYFMFETRTLVEAEKRTVSSGDVPWFLQPAHVAAKALGGPGYTPVGTKPEDIINNAILTFLRGSHTVETWKMAGNILNSARTAAGIAWDQSLIKPELAKEMGITVSKRPEPEPEPEPEVDTPAPPKESPAPEPSADKADDTAPMSPSAADARPADAKDRRAPEPKSPSPDRKEKSKTVPTAESVEIEVSLGSPMKNVTDEQKRDAALAFAAATCPSMTPNGVTAEQIVNQAVSTWFMRHAVPLEQDLKVLGKALDTLSDLGIAWDHQLVPASYMAALQLPSVKVVTVDTERGQTAADKKVDSLETLLLKL